MLGGCLRVGSTSMGKAFRVSAVTLARLEKVVTDGLAGSLGEAVEWFINRVAALEQRLVEGEGDNEKPVKRVSLGGDEKARQALVAETALSKIWQFMQTMKDAPLPECPDFLEQLGSPLFPCEWGSLLLRLPENPHAGGLSRMEAVQFLLSGWTVTVKLWCLACLDELKSLDGRVVAWVKAKGELGDLAAEFTESCPLLDELFSRLVVWDSRVYDNKKKTADFKREVFVLLACALGKLRTQQASALGCHLFRLWRQLGVPNDAIDCLAALGLSVTCKRGKEEELRLVKAAQNQLLHLTRKRGSGQLYYGSVDNLDENYKSFKQQMGNTNTGEHFINSALYAFASHVPLHLKRDRVRFPDVLTLGVFQLTGQADARVMAYTVENLMRVLHPLLDDFTMLGKPLKFGVKTSASDYELKSLGASGKTKVYPRQTANLSEGKTNEFFLFYRQFVSEFPSSEKVYVSCDAKTYLLMRKAHVLYQGEKGVDLDCDDNAAIPVPGEDARLFFLVSLSERLLSSCGGRVFGRLYAPQHRSFGGLLRHDGEDVRNQQECGKVDER